VFKCVNQATNDIVALNRSQVPKNEEHEGISSTTLRELSALIKLKCMPGIVTLLDVILTKDYKQYLVFGYLKYDLLKYQDEYRPLSKVMV
jgi:serine/threonine protein kinase